jgi:hypothetical protein
VFLRAIVMTCCTNPVHTATNTTACRELQLSKSSSTTCCRMSVCLFLCVTSHSVQCSLQLAVLTVHKPVHPAVARLTCKQLQLTSLPCTAFAQHGNARMPVCSRVLTQPQIDACSLYPCGHAAQTCRQRCNTTASR